MNTGSSISSGTFAAVGHDSLRTNPFRSSSLRRWLLGESAKALLLFLLVFAAYRPLLPGSFLMDDRRLIEGSNPIVQGELTPRSVWFQTDFPLTTLAFWSQWKLWGPHPAGYHVVNLLLHGLSAVLIWRLGRKLNLPGSWLAGAIFAVHPVAVVSVGRIAELKNTLSLPFFLISLLAYLRFDDASRNPAKEQTRADSIERGFSLAISLLAFVLGLLAKTSGVMVPIIMLLLCAWRCRAFRWRDLLQTSPFFAIALGFGLLTVWFQKFQALAGETIHPQSFWARLGQATHNFCFYLQKALLPVNLNVVYGQSRAGWTFADAFLLLSLFAIVTAVYFVFRRSRCISLMVALACFGIALFPALGFFDAQFISTLSISDHLQYLPMVCLIMMVAAALSMVSTEKYLPRISLGIIVILGVLTFERARIFGNEEAVWRDTLSKNPGASGAHNDLGCILAEQGKLVEAKEHFGAAVRADDNNWNAHSNLGLVFGGQGNVADAETQFQTALKSNPNHAETHKRYAALLRESGRPRDAILHLRMAIGHRADVSGRLELARLHYKMGDFPEAAAQLRRILASKADEIEACNSLAWLLATCSQKSMRNGAEAVEFAARACRLTHSAQPHILATFAAAQAEAGQFVEAIAAAGQAVRLAAASGDLEAASLNRRLLSLYRRHEAFHEPAPIVQEAMDFDPNLVAQ